MPDQLHALNQSRSRDQPFREIADNVNDRDIGETAIRRRAFAASISVFDPNKGTIPLTLRRRAVAMVLRRVMER